MSTAFRLMEHSLKRGYTLVEASAGTGKTYSITWLVVRLLLEEELEAEELLVVTFTIAATEELDSRIRVHLNEVLAAWPRDPNTVDLSQLSPELSTLYSRLSPEQRAGGPQRLQRALDHFDLAQISTIHGFCGQMLRDYPLESGIESTTVQTHLAPLYEEIAEDFRSLVISESSRPALRLMNAVSKSLKHDTESLIKICHFLEPESWSAVYCDPLILPISHHHEATPELLELVRLSQSMILPPPPPAFEDVELEENQDFEKNKTESGELFPELSGPPDRCSLRPHHVVNAWRHLGELFDHTVNVRLIPSLQRSELRESLRTHLEELNETAVWTASGGEDKQSLGWEAIEQVLELIREERNPISPVITLHQDLARLSTSGIVGGLHKSRTVNKPHLEFSHPLSEVLEELAVLMSEVTRAMKGWFRWGFAVYAQEELTRRKRAEGWISTNDLVRLTHAALHRPDGLFLEQVQARFKGALIDEFQDTDPMQWGIFSAVLNPKESKAITYLIGDPKQSIYRFRGADLNAYLAVKTQIEPERAFTMSRNFRSDPRVLDALNQHFDPRTERHLLDHWSIVPAGESSKGEGFFLDEHVPYVHVDGGRDNRAEAFPALRWRYFELDLVTTRDNALAEYTAEDICQFLSCRHKIGRGDRSRAVTLSDIGVLTRTNDFAVHISLALAKRGIASTIRGDSDVFKTSATAQLERLVRGLLIPEDEGALRAALAIELLGFDAQDVRVRSEELKEIFTQLHSVWLSQGFSAAFHALIHHPQLRFIERALHHPEGARDLSRMLHVVERIQARESTLSLSPELTLQWLRERRLDSDVEPSEEDEVRPHIDTEAVQVVTVHRSKGLEYPILFCPDLWIVRRGKASEICVTEPATPGEPRALDLRTEKSELRDALNAQIEASERREERRLLYVALTRAIHHCSIYLSVPTSNFHHSPLYPMMMGAVPLPKTQPKRPVYDSMIISRGEERFIESQGQVTFEVERRAPRFTLWSGASQEASSLVAHPTPEPSEHSWRIASFSSLAALTEARESSNIISEGYQELDEVSHGKVTAHEHIEGPPPPLIDLVGGARFGQCIHSLLEKIDFDRVDENTLERLSGLSLNAWGFDKRFASRVAQGLWRAINTPLASPEPEGDEGAWAMKTWRQYNLHQFRLRELSRAHRRDEVRFELPLSSGDEPLSAKLLNQILRLDPACHGLPSLPDDLSLSGFLKGSIDLMFRVPHQSGARYYIADYKTHWLGDEQGSHLGHYHPKALREVMNMHHYHLQSHLYQVALHRLLEQRLGEAYHPERDFGGSYFFFLRGMAGEASRLSSHPHDQGATGVYYHRPVPLVTELISIALSSPSEARQRLRSLGMMAH